MTGGAGGEVGAEIKTGTRTVEGVRAGIMMKEKELRRRAAMRTWT